MTSWIFISHACDMQHVRRSIFLSGTFFEHFDTLFLNNRITGWHVVGKSSWEIREVGECWIVWSWKYIIQVRNIWTKWEKISIGTINENNLRTIFPTPRFFQLLDLSNYTQARTILQLQGEFSNLILNSRTFGLLNSSRLFNYNGILIITLTCLMRVGLQDKEFEFYSP